MLLFSWGVIAQTITPPANIDEPNAGEPTNPYEISSVENLLWIFDQSGTATVTLANRMSAYYEQTTSISFPADINTWNGNTGWDPIGTSDDPFLGNYDGGGNSITGLYINQPTTVGNVGLFGYIGTGTQADPVVIQNLQLIGPQVAGGRGTGSLVGRVVGNIYTLIEGCSAIKDDDQIGTVTGTSATGGLVGANNSETETPGGTNNPIISKCYSDIDVIGLDDPDETFTQKIGGLVGCNQKGTTRNSYARGSVTIEGSEDFERLGGLAGCTDIRGRIEYSYSTGGVYYNNAPVSSSNNSTTNGTLTLYGGLVGNVASQGQGNNGVVVDSYWDTETSDQPTSAGGTGLLTTEIQNQNNLVGFDFTNVWAFQSGVNDDYAVLQNVVLTQFITWTGATNNDWETAGNWSPDTRIPVAADIAVIPDDLTRYPIISTAITTPAKEVDVQAGAPGTTSATITITPSGSFTVTNTLRTDPPGIIIESDATGTGSLIHNSPEVYGTIYRHITGEAIPGSGDATKYHTVSVPLTQSSNPLSGLFIDSYLYGYDHATVDKWVAFGAPTNTPLPVDQGYLIYYPENNPRTYTFTGTLNNDEFEVAVKQVGTATKTLNLVPNPYPSAIDWDLVVKTDVDDAIWIWNPTAGNYGTYGSDIGTLNATKDIPVGQAFFVRTASESTVSPTLVFNNDVRVHSDQAFFKNKEQQNNLLRIKALANNYSDEIVVRFRDGATSNFDSQYDAGKMFGMGGSPQLYSVSADGQKLSINSIAATSEVVSIPVGFELETDGEVTLEISSVDSFDPEMPVFLWDKQADNMIDLRQTAQYTFVHDVYNNEQRFELLFNSAVSVDDIAATIPKVKMHYSDQQLHLNIPEAIGKNPTVSLFNTNGQLVLTTQTQAGTSSVLVSGLSQGIYMVQITGESHSVTEKVSIN
jgi:hypothetical protein